MIAQVGRQLRIVPSTGNRAHQYCPGAWKVNGKENPNRNPKVSSNFALANLTHVVMGNAMAPATTQHIPEQPSGDRPS